MPRRVRTIRPTGLSLDLPPYSLPLEERNGVIATFWNDAENMSFGQGLAERARGFSGVYGTPLFPPRWLLNPRSSVAFWWLYMGDTGVGVVDNVGIHTDITGAAFDVTGLHNPFTGGIIQGLPAVNTSLIEPQWWDLDIGTNLQTLPDWPAGDTCNALRPFREFLIAMDVFSSGQRLQDLVRWSDAAAPGAVPQSWTPGANSQAGELSLAFMPGRVIDGLSLRQSFILYKTHSTWTLDLIGGTFVFSQRPVFTKLGMLSSGCAVELRGKHLVLTDGDVVLHDGVTAESIADQRVRRTLFAGLDDDNFQNSWVALDKEAGEVWIATPEAGATYPTKILIWSVGSGEWGIRELPEFAHGLEGIVETVVVQDTWDTATDTWATITRRWNAKGLNAAEESLMLADPAGPTLFAVGRSTLADGAIVPGRVQRASLDFGTPDVVKHVGRIFPHIEGRPGEVIQVRAGGQLNGSDSPINWSAESAFAIGVDRHVDTNADGHYLSFEFRSSDDFLWRLTSFDVELRERGAW